MQEAARGVSAMFRIAVCDENTMVRKKMKQLAAAYMESRECKAEIYEAACEQEVPAKVHAILNLRQLVENELQQQFNSKDILTFPFREGERRLTLHQIVYVESKLHRLYFHLEDGQIRTMYGILNEWEEKMCNDDFPRIHQSYLVNMRYIREISGCVVFLEKGTELTVPRTRYRQVRERFMAYQRGV